MYYLLLLFLRILGFLCSRSVSFFSDWVCTSPASVGLPCPGRPQPGPARAEAVPWASCPQTGFATPLESKSCLVFRGKPLPTSSRATSFRPAPAFCSGPHAGPSGLCPLKCLAWGWGSGQPWPLPAVGGGLPQGRLGPGGRADLAQGVQEGGPLCRVPGLSSVEEPVPSWGVAPSHPELTVTVC